MSILTSSGVRRSRWALSFADLLLLLLGFFVMLHASGQRRDVMLAQVRQQFGGHVRRAMEIRAAELFLPGAALLTGEGRRSEEHTSELQSLMRISYAVFCLKKKKKHHDHYERRTTH